MASGPKKTKNGKWEIRWYEGTRHKGRSFTLKGDAETFKTKVERSEQLGEPVRKRTGHETLAEFFARWLLQREASLAPNTTKLYTQLFATHVFEQLGYVPLNHLTHERLEDWQTERLKDGAGPEAIAKAGRLLHGVFRKAVRQGKMRFNPIDGMDKPRVERKKAPPASPETVEAMRDWFNSQGRDGDAVLVSVLAYGGLRVGEALALQWEDFSAWDRIWVSHSLEDDGTLKTTKTGKERMVVLPEPVAQDLIVWRRETGPQGFVFPRKTDGKGWTRTDRGNWRNHFYNKAAEHAGWPYPPQALRMSAASLLIAAGKKHTEVADILGHSPAVSVNVYQRLMREMEGKPTRSVDEMISEARSGKVGENANGRHRSHGPPRHQEVES